VVLSQRFWSLRFTVVHAQPGCRSLLVCCLISKTWYKLAQRDRLWQPLFTRNYPGMSEHHMRHHIPGHIHDGCVCMALRAMSCWHCHELRCLALDSTLLDELNNTSSFATPKLAWRQVWFAIKSLVSLVLRGLMCPSTAIPTQGRATPRLARRECCCSTTVEWAHWRGKRGTSRLNRRLKTGKQHRLRT
jgi:hypothetical protein